MTKARIGSILVLLMIAGVTLRIVANNNRLLRQDEAETTVNSLQVLERGYPHGQYKQKPLYENKNTIRSNDTKYAYESSNYFQSRYERNKGWLTYYYQALFIKIFGVSTFTARLPFVLLAIPALFFLFKIGSAFFSTNVALLSCSLYTINYYSILYERQARYYSLLVVFSLACILTFYNAITRRRVRDYFTSGVCLTLLFYSHIVAFIVATILFVSLHVLYTHSIRAVLRRPVLLTLLGVGCCITPWIILVKFWEVRRAFTGFDVVYPLVGVATGVLLYAACGRKLFRNKTLFPVHVLEVFTVMALLIRPMITPQESQAFHLFLDLNPVIILLVIGIAFGFHRNNYVLPSIASATHIVVLICLFLFLTNFRKPPLTVTDADWVKPSISFLAAAKVSTQTPVFVSSHQTTFLLYSNFNVDPIWPIRKSFIDSFHGRIIFIFDTRDFLEKMLYRENIITAKDLNFYDKIKECQQHPIYANKVIIFDCPEQIATPT